MGPKDPAELRCRILNAADNLRLALGYLRRGSYYTGIPLVEQAEAELRRLGLAVDPARWDAPPPSAGTFVDAGGDGDDTLELAGAAIDARLAESADEGPHVLAVRDGKSPACYFVRVGTDDIPDASTRLESARVWPSRGALEEWLTDQPGQVRYRLLALGFEPTPRPVADDPEMRQADEAIRPAPESLPSVRLAGNTLVFDGSHPNSGNDRLAFLEAMDRRSKAGSRPVPTLSQSQVMYGTGERWPSR